MVEINNQRAFLDVGVVWGIDNGRQKPETGGYDVIVGGELFIDYSDHPRKLVTLNPNQINRRRTLPASSRWRDAHRKQLSKDFSSEKSGRQALQQIKERGAFTYDWSWWYPSANRPLQQYSGFTAGRWLWFASDMQVDSLIAKFKEAAERSERLMYEQSHRDYLRLVICIIVRPSWAVNHYRDNAITYKAQRDKNARISLANAATRHADASAWCCCARCKIHEVS